jgi:hypothetical protein
MSEIHVSAPAIARLTAVSVQAAHKALLGSPGILRGVPHDIALCPPLKAIVPEGRNRLKCRFNVPRLNELGPLLLRAVRPEAGETVSLQFDAYPHTISFRLVHWALGLLHLGHDPEQVLNMMANLVSDHIGLGELTALAANVASVETLFKILEEACVEINLLVQRTVERADGGLRKPASGSGRSRKHTSFGGL